MSESRLSGAALLLLLAALVVTVVLPWSRFDFLHQDDAYISYVYARNFARGDGLVFNAGEPAVEGYTNFLWTLGIGWGMRAGLDPERIAPAAGLLASLGAVGLTFVAARRLGATAGFAAAGALLFALRPTLTTHTLGGLETPAFAMLLLAGLLPHLRDGNRPRDHLLSALALATAALIRPEGILVFGLVELFLIGASRLGRQPFAAWVREGLRRWVPFGVIVGAHLLWRYATYGDWVPNTFHAKVEPSLEVWTAGLRYAFDAALYFGAFLFALPYLLAAGWLRRRGVLLCLFVSSAFLAYVAYVGGDYLPGFRHLLAVMPLWCALAAVSFSELAARMGGAKARVAVAAAFTLVAGLNTAFEYGNTSYWREQDRRHRELVAAGRKLNEILPPRAWIAVTNAGRLPYFADRRTIDMMGLSDAHIAARSVAGASPDLIGHLKGDGKYVLDRGPDVILFLHQALLPQPMTGFEHPWRAARNMTFGISEREIVADERFERDYELWSVELPGAGAYLNFFARAGVFGDAPPPGTVRRVSAPAAG